MNSLNDNNHKKSLFTLTRPFSNTSSTPTAGDGANSAIAAASFIICSKQDRTTCLALGCSISLCLDRTRSKRVACSFSSSVLLARCFLRFKRTDSVGGVSRSSRKLHVVFVAMSPYFEPYLERPERNMRFYKVNL